MRAIKYNMFYFLFQAQNEVIGAAVAEIASQQQLYPQTGTPKYIERCWIVYLFLFLTFINQIDNLKVYVFTAKIDIFLNSNSYVHQLFNANATMYRNSTLLCFAQENMKTVLKSRILFQS